MHSDVVALSEILGKIKVVEHSFAYNRVVGNVGKELVRALLEACGYSVYPFGYESYFTHIKDLMHAGKIRNDGKIRKLRQIQRMPDLLVVDEEDGGVEMVEVIVRTGKKANDTDIEKQKLDELKDFWAESVLAVVLPRDEQVFYAERVDRLKITDPDFVNFDISGSPINKIFPKVDRSPKVLEELQDLCKKLFQAI